MANAKSLVSKLEEIANLIDLDKFYSIGLSPGFGQISLQGDFSDTNTKSAKELGVKLEYDEGQGMLKGESEDGKLRIVLT